MEQNIEFVQEKLKSIRRDYDYLFQLYYFSKIMLSVVIVQASSDSCSKMKFVANLIFTTVALEFIVWIASMKNASTELKERYSDDIGVLYFLSDIILFSSVLYSAAWSFSPLSTELAIMALLTATFGNLSNALFKLISERQKTYKFSCLRR